MRLNIHEMKQAAQLVLDWHCYIDLAGIALGKALSAGNDPSL